MVKMTISKPGNTYQTWGVPAFLEMKNMMAPIASVKAPTAPTMGHGLGSTRW